MEDLDNIGRRYNTDGIEIIRKFIRIGLLIVAIDEDPNSKIIYEEENRQRELILFPSPATNQEDPAS